MKWWCLGWEGDGVVVFTRGTRGIHTEKCTGGGLGGGELGYKVGWRRGVWGVRGQGMVYYGSGIAVV